jgi:hypothetical protein
VTEALDRILERGILGALLVVALFTIGYLFKKYSDEKDARINDGKETQKLLMQFQSTSIDMVHKLAEIVEWVEKRIDEPIKERRRP